MFDIFSIFNAKWNPFVRLLTCYDLHIWKLSLCPQIMSDIYERRNYLTLGFAVGIGIHTYYPKNTNFINHT
jgi:hypothetical protein